MDGRPSVVPASTCQGHLAPPLADSGVSLVLPACNEEASIRRAIAEADAALAALADDYEILVVDDGSSDGTAEIVTEEAVERPRVRLLRHDTNRGYGAALRTGFEAARFDRVAFSDADSQFDLMDLELLLPLAEQYPVVAGYRTHRQDSWRRRLLSRGFNLLARGLLGTGVRDCDCALKVFQRSALTSLLPESQGFLANAEMLARARQQGLAVVEVPVQHRPRLQGASKVSLAEVPRVLAALLPFWWSRLLFPARFEGGAAVPRRPPLLALALVLLVASLLFFVRLRAPLLEPQEPRYAEIPREMLAQGSLLVPVLDGRPYLDKPPLLYWLVMASYSLFGVHDWAARLVPALAGLLTVLVTYLWGRRALGERAGLCGALGLCLSAAFVYRQRMLTMDGLLCLWVVSSLASANVALLGRTLRWPWWLLSAACCALGVLTKGPVALVLVAVPVLAHQWLDRRGARLSLWNWAAFTGVALGLALPWYLAMQMRIPEFGHYFFWQHHVERFLTPFDHDKPAWFYLPVLLLGLLPWTLLLPGFAYYLGRRSLRQALRRPAELGLPLLAGLWCVLFFSLAGCKRPGYVLPALPPLALALGCYVDRLVPWRRGSVGWDWLWRWRSVMAYRAAVLVLLVGLVLVVAAAGRHLVRPVPAGLLSMAATAGLLALLGRRRLSWASCAGIAFVVLLLGTWQLLPGYNRQFALTGRLHATPEQAAELGPVLCYPQRFDSVSFYLPGADVRAYGPDQREQFVAELRSRPRTLVFVKSGQTLEDLLRDLPASVEFVSRGRPGAITAGWVRPRAEPPAALYASR
jgi:4-amino-4-deoxy-L-arabinose transferase-like glycosyltransferase